MIKKLSIYLSTIVLVTSCYKFDKPDKPKNLIPKEQMVNILLDIRLLSSANGSNKIILENNNIYQNTYIYNKYQIDSLQFALSNNYYAYYVKDYKAIYAKVKDSLDVLRNEFKALEEQERIEKRAADSIARLKKKDTLKPNIDSQDFLRKRDSLKSLVVKDSLTEALLQKKFEEGTLIEPVSENDSQ